MNINRRNLWKEAFGDTDEFLDIFSATAYADERSNGIEINGKTVAALYWFDCEYKEKKIAYIYAVATAKAHRGQGLCHRLMNDTHRLLREQGYAGAMLVPGNRDLVDLYADMGYEPCTRVGQLSVTAEGSTECMPIDKCGYAVLRRQFLPQGGVMQEGENLDFLERQAAFYRGNDFVLAARKEGEKLIGMELLGNTETAAAIVGALGCKTGEFRIPNGNIPFAMGFFFEEMTKPTYFGLAFD